jgi:hypothetical protein
MCKDNHHYVPQFYLRKFSHNNRNIDMYISDKNKYIKNANISKQASKKKFYGETDVIENDLMNLEHKVSIIINKIIESKKFPSKETEEYSILMIFILTSSARVPREADNISSMIDKFYKELMIKDNSIDIDEGDLNDFIIKSDVPSVLPMQVAIKSYPAIIDLKPILLISNCDKRFITSDNPVTKYNLFAVIRDYEMRGYGITSRGLMIFLPLTDKICMLLYDEDVYEITGLNENILFICKGKIIDELNRLTYLDSYRFLYYKCDTNERYISKLVNNNKPTFSTDNNFSVIPSNIGEVIGFHSHATRDRINMNFVKLKSEYIKCELPSHLGGLNRPKAELLMKVVENYNFS